MNTPSPADTRRALLEDAIEAITGQREEDYGSAENSFATIAALWTTYLVHRGNTVPFIRPHDVPLMMDLLKTARLIQNPEHRDSWLDKAGYSACGFSTVVEKGHAD